MKNKLVLVVIGLVVLIFVGVLLLSRTNSLDTFSSFSKPKSIPVNWGTTPEAILDDSYIFFAFDNNVSVSYYRQYFSDDKVIKIGSIDNFALGSRGLTQINDKLYFYIGIIYDRDIKPYEGGEKNILYSIDIKNSVLESYPPSEGITAPGINQMTSFDSKVAAILRAYDGEKTNTYIDIFDTEKRTWRQVLFNTFNNGINTGLKLVGLWADSNRVYVICDHCMGDTDNFAMLDIYDTNFNLIRSVKMPDDMRSTFIQDTDVWDFSVFKDYLYVKNSLNYSCIGKIKDETIELLKEGQFTIAYNQLNLNIPVFYYRMDKRYFELDLKTGPSKEYTLQFAQGYKLMGMLATNNKALMHCVNGDKPLFLYYIPRKNLSNTYIPCG